MSHENNVLKFDLNELLSFQKGQEVMELIGIALEPDISIYDSDDYVTIRGVIELTGEYMPHKNDAGTERNEQVLSFHDHQLKNFIQDVRSYEDGLNEFHYNIPLEVTIPKYRVPSLDDVMVEIDYFDYEIPEPSHLKLQAEIIITGIEQETIAHEVETNRNEVTDDQKDWEEVSQPFSFDLKFETEDSSSLYEENESRKEVSLSPNSEESRPQVPEEVEINEVEDEKLESIEEDTDKERELWFKKKSQTLGEFFGHKKEESSSEIPWNDESPKDLSPSDYYEAEHAFNEERPKVEYKIEATNDEDDSETREDVFYLVNMFNKEEESFSKIRMCIVQETDTIDSIAERYDMSKTQLLRFNKIDEEETVGAGKILYIPRLKQKDPS